MDDRRPDVLNCRGAGRRFQREVLPAESGRFAHTIRSSLPPPGAVRSGAQLRSGRTLIDPCVLREAKSRRRSQRPGKVIVVPLMVIATDLVGSTSAGTATVEVAAAASPVHPPPLGFSALVVTVMVCPVPRTESGSSGQPELPQVTIRSCPGPPQAAVTRRADAPASVVGTGMSAANSVVHEITGEALVED